MVADLTLPPNRLILCIGNRYLEQDALGPLVFDCLSRIPHLPNNVAILDGALRGIDLLPQLEGLQRVVFVDQLAINTSETITVLSGEAVAGGWSGHYGHDNGLGYLLACLPYLCAPPGPEVVIVGSSERVSPALVQAVAKRALAEANHGHC